MANPKDWKESAREIIEKVKARSATAGSAVRRAMAPVGRKLAPVGRKIGGAIAGTALFKKLSAKAKAQTLDPSQAAENLTQLFQNAGLSFYGLLLTIFLCTWFLADLTSLVVEDYIPEPPRASLTQPRTGAARQRTIEEYGVIFTRNLFNSQGLIPGEETQGGPTDQGGEPVKTTLPLNLIGTIILSDELRSLATIEDKSASQVYPVRIDDEIPSKARILSIQSRKVIFINVASGRREFVELPEDPVTSNPRVSFAPKGGGGGKGAGIERTSPNNFAVSRSEIDKQLGDLNNVLTQARCVPNFENGMPSGFKCFQIVPGSIYDKLGLQNGDVLVGVDGDPINDPAKAFELLNKLKTTNHVELTIKRDGKQQNYAYDIN